MLPLVAETAFWSLESLRVAAAHTLLVHGAGTMVGFAAVQIALIRNARVIATAGDAFAEQLRALGAAVTTYGDDVVERILGIIGAFQT